MNRQLESEISMNDSSCRSEQNNIQSEKQYNEQKQSEDVDRKTPMIEQNIGNT